MGGGQSSGSWEQDQVSVCLPLHEYLMHLLRSHSEGLSLVVRGVVVVVGAASGELARKPHPRLRQGTGR